MNKKIALILIMLIGVGLYALPQTVALFAGQHSFVNIDNTGNQIECVKCHGDVRAELSSGTNTMTGTPGPHADFKCEYCHRIEAGSSSGDDAYEVIGYTIGSGTTAGTVYLATDIMNMESFNIPPTILANSTTTQIKAMTTESGTLFTKGTMAVSPCYVNKLVSTTGNCAAGTVLIRGANNGIKLTSTYNTTTHQPLDTNPTTKNSGLDLSKVGIGNWTMGSRSATPTLYGAGSKAANPGTSYHAASLVSCMECHGGDEPMGHYSRVVDGEANNGAADCSNCHYGGGNSATGEFGTKMTTLWAGGFGLTPMAGDTGATEAHMNFVRTNDSITRFKDEASNGACVACHTHVAVDIVYTKPTTMTFNSDIRDGTVGGFSMGSGTTYTYSGN